MSTIIYNVVFDIDKQEIGPVHAIGEIWFEIFCDHRISSIERIGKEYVIFVQSALGKDDARRQAIHLMENYVK